MSVELSINNQVLYVSGFIGFDNAARVYAQGIALIQQLSAGENIVIDLAELTSSNTISLAVFVQWLRVCLPQQAIQLLHVPRKMHDIIGASSLDRKSVV